MKGKSNLKGAAMAAAMILPGLVFSQQISVLVNGQPVMFPGIGPQQVGGRVLVPLRGVMEQLGAYVDYQSTTRTVTATKSGTDLVLRLGDRHATVNGHDVYLDVPAQEMRGSTMVPLRFVGEALGAEVKWNPATYTVNIATAENTDQNTYIPPNRQTLPTTPPLPTNVTISSFDVDHSGTIRGGENLRLTLQGTPGGVATFSIPGVIADVPMTELQPGTYVGTFRVPANSPINITRASAIAHLRVNGVDRMIQSGTSLGFDTQAPLITAVTPNDDSRINRARPNISATFDDGTGTGIDPSTVQVLLDNRDVTRDAQVTPTLVSYRPDQALSGGIHDVTVIAQDKAGNTVRKSWSFQVRSNAETIRSFTYDAGGQRLVPGTEVTFTLTGEPGGRATFSVGDRILDRAMTEVSPGKYVGYYTIRRNDNFDNMPVTAKLINNGETFAYESATRFNVESNSALEAPLFTYPSDNATVGRNLTLRGTAAPGSRVQIKIDYVTNALGLIRMTGTVAELEVVADDQGNWRTDPIDLNTGLGSGPTTFNVTATTIGANGRKSTTTKLTLKR